jgi:hypothetical protein
VKKLLAPKRKKNVLLAFTNLKWTKHGFNIIIHTRSLMTVLRPILNAKQIIRYFRLTSKENERIDRNELKLKMNVPYFIIMFSRDPVQIKFGMKSM